MGELLNANRNTALHVLQAAQSRAYDIPGRMVALGRYLEEQRVALMPVYSRILDLPDAGVAVARPALGEEELIATGLEPYEAELRNQIRKAVRNAMKVTYELPADVTEVPAAYRDSSRFTALHGSGPECHPTTSRTGRHCRARCSAAEAATSSHTYATVTVRPPPPSCHVRDGHTLYWAGCSSEHGMRANANPLCLHAAIQASRAIGVHRFELGRFFAREPSAKERAITPVQGSVRRRACPHRRI